MPSRKSVPRVSACATPPELSGRDREERRLTDRIEGQREQGSHSGHPERATRCCEASEEATLDADELHYAAGRCPQDRVKIDQAQEQQKADRDPGAKRIKP
jgi:hypothetical protein